jgi:hypothetical protein
VAEDPLYLALFYFQEIDDEETTETSQEALQEITPSQASRDDVFRHPQLTGF